MILLDLSKKYVLQINTHSKKKCNFFLIFNHENMHNLSRFFEAQLWFLWDFTWVNSLKFIYSSFFIILFPVLSNYLFRKLSSSFSITYCSTLKFSSWKVVNSIEIILLDGSYLNSYFNQFFCSHYVLFQVELW